MTAARVDIHQHLWTESLLGALAERDRLPFVRRNGPTAILHCSGECAYAIDTEIETPSQRAAEVRDAGLDLALIALSSPIGIEALPRAEARDLIEAYLEGVASLTSEFGAWGPVPLDRPTHATSMTSFPADAWVSRSRPERSRAVRPSSASSRCWPRPRTTTSRCSSTPDPVRRPRSAHLP